MWERKNENIRERGVLGQRSNLPPADVRFSSSHTSSGDNSTSALRSSIAIFPSTSISCIHYKTDPVKYNKAGDVQLDV